MDDSMKAKDLYATLKQYDLTFDKFDTIFVQNVEDLDTLVKQAKESYQAVFMKLLAKGEIGAKLTIEISSASKSAIAAVEKAGGSVVLPAPIVKPAGKGKKHEREKAAKAAVGAKAPAAEESES